jgi:hypothetical protein
VHDYDRLEREPSPTSVRDWTAKWDTLEPVGDVNGTVRTQLDQFCERKRITLEGLQALDTRILIRNDGTVCVAWAGRNRAGVVTALKHRPIGGSSHETKAEAPSVWLAPIIAGNRSSDDWLLVEGETDAARLHDLVGDSCAIVCLPTGATFKTEWVRHIARDVTLLLCHDADDAGDKGAEKAAKILGGNTLRVRPPDGVKDWCDWDGSREQFVELVAAARASKPSYEFSTLADFLAYPFPNAEPLLGEDRSIILAVGSLLLVYGAEGAGKSTWTIDGIAHLAAGVDWLGFTVNRPGRICVIENEGPPSLFQRKLADKADTWEGPTWAHNVCVFQGPWGEFSFANPEARLALRDYCEENAIDVVTANPTLGLGVSGSGRPDETQTFVDWLVECGLKSTRAFWLLHHENKAGQISGDWGRHPDTKVQLQIDGKQPRTKLVWEKTRWATLPTDEHPKAVLLEWIVETQGYTMLDLDTVGASDSELETRIADYLSAHPWSSTRTVWDNVTGTNTRIRKLLEGDRFDCVDGPRGSILWGIANDRVGEADALAESGTGKRDG